VASKQSGLEGAKILIVEDEYYLADDLAGAFARHGAIVLGPVGTVERALRLVEQHDRIDGAVLDINLRGEPAFPISDLLRRRNVPFIFATGYDEGIIPEMYESAPRWEKPYDAEQLIASAAALFLRGGQAEPVAPDRPQTASDR
jgi:DNA-binding response OmpR family regulator